MKKHSLSFAIAILVLGCSLQAQAKKKSISFKDSLDKAFDLSANIIDANGFLPIPYIITGPAVGGLEEPSFLFS